VKRYILTVGDSFDPNKADLSDIDVVSVEKLTTCRDCEFYGRAYSKYCELIDKYIPTSFFCNFAKPESEGTDETFFYVDNIKL
jgi:hypothetical protein